MLVILSFTQVEEHLHDPCGVRHVVQEAVTTASRRRFGCDMRRKRNAKRLVRQTSSKGVNRGRGKATERTRKERSTVRGQPKPTKHLVPAAPKVTNCA